jgi:PQQ-dependent catabolism-associated CXXCW motif protein
MKWCSTSPADLGERRARFTLAIVDACRDNPFRRSGRAIGGSGLAPTAPATGQMVIYSAGVGQQALDQLNDSDKDRNGLFARVLLRELQRPGISADRLIRNVREEVAKLAQTVRHDQIPAIYDQALGDFYFKPAAQKVDRPTAERPAAEPTAPPDPGIRAAGSANEDRDFGVAPTQTAKRIPYNGPTPTTIPGGQVIRTPDLIRRLKEEKELVVIDVNNSNTRTTIPGAWWLRNGGEAPVYQSERIRFEEALSRLTGGNKAQAVVFLCVSSSCWLSYNAALLAIELGFTQVFWYRGGTAAWNGANQELAEPKRL